MKRVNLLALLLSLMLVTALPRRSGAADADPGGVRIADQGCALTPAIRAQRARYLDRESARLTEALGAQGLELARLQNDYRSYEDGRHDRRNMWRVIKPMITVASLAIAGYGIYRVFILGTTEVIPGIAGSMFPAQAWIRSQLLNRAWSVTSNGLFVLTGTGIIAMPASAGPRDLSPRVDRSSSGSVERALDPATPASRSNWNLLASPDCGRNRCDASRPDIDQALREVDRVAALLSEKLHEEVRRAERFWRVRDVFGERRLAQIDIPIASLKLDLLNAKRLFVISLKDILVHDARACGGPLR